jgi:hypothetical protein
VFASFTCGAGPLLRAVIHMKYADEEILAYAKKHIRHLNQQKGKRLVLGFMGVGAITIVVLLVRLVLEKSDKAGVNFFQDAHFITGMAFDIFGVLVVGIAVLCFLRMFSVLYGKDIEVYRLLLKLNEEKNR